MLKNKKIIKTLVMELLIFICWCTMVFVFANFDEAGFYLKAGIGFGIFSFAVAAASFILIDFKNNRNTTEINFIPVYYTIAYLFAEACVNSIFICLVSGKHNALLVGLNLVILIVFAGFRIHTDGYINRVDINSKKAILKSRSYMEISMRLSEIIAASEDLDVKKKLLKLKEAVDYSSNISHDISSDFDDSFLLQLDVIQTSINSRARTQDIIENIEKASTIWKKRNAVITDAK